MTFETVLLAFIQGLTEFLPVSSSGHLLIAERFGITNQSLGMDAALHLGTLVAVCVYFAKDLIALLFGIWKSGHERTLALQLIVATIPVLIFGYFTRELIETAWRTPVVVGVAAIFFGIMLWYIDVRSPKNKTLGRLTYRGALFIGILQILALIPGTSRSGITMTAARAIGIKRVDAAKFSMLLSIPTISCAGGYALWDACRTQTMTMNNEVISGICLSALFGLVAISFLMKWVSRASFGIFAVYRVTLGVFLLFWFL